MGTQVLGLKIASAPDASNMMDLSSKSNKETVSFFQVFLQLFQVFYRAVPLA
ncbi:MAG: hypothetical protein AAGD25_29915 [Cyanobacteria bacterium P01_F01_bin.150]